MNKPFEAPVLRLASLAEGMPGLSPRCGACLAEAAAVCLEEQGHGLSSALLVKGSFNRFLTLLREGVDGQARASYDPREATEWGACGISILVLGHLLEVEVVERSWIGSGFDYYLSPRFSPRSGLPFSDVIRLDVVRLEVTGTRQGSYADIARLVGDRCGRLEGKPSSIIVAVEFSRPLAYVVKL